jgi:hypothetical protein
MQRFCQACLVAYASFVSHSQTVHRSALLTGTLVMGLALHCAPAVYVAFISVSPIVTDTSDSDSVADNCYCGRGRGPGLGPGPGCGGGVKTTS